MLQSIHGMVPHVLMKATRHDQNEAKLFTCSISGASVAKVTLVVLSKCRTQHLSLLQSKSLYRLLNTLTELDNHLPLLKYWPRYLCPTR